MAAGGGSSDHAEVVRLLVNAGASKSIACMDGSTPLSKAREVGNIQAMHYLS